MEIENERTLKVTIRWLPIFMNVDVPLEQARAQTLYGRGIRRRYKSRTKGQGEHDRIDIKNRSPMRDTFAYMRILRRLFL